MSNDRWTRLSFREAPAEYVGPTQKVRIWTEGWVADQMFCPSCGERRIEQHKANNPAADFYCRKCGEEFELKSQRARFGARIVDGALATMTSRLAAGRAPNLLVLNYDKDRAEVRNLLVIPKQFFVSSIIEARRPLSSTARRAGWQGCNILLSRVPDAGKVWLVQDGAMRDPQAALEDWRRTLFLREASPLARGWLVEVLMCVEAITANEFALADVYAFEAHLASLYPGNDNVRPKIRQQLQVLRDRGLLEFLGSGQYRKRRLQ